MRRLVCEYYDGFSFGKMIRQYPELRRHAHRSADRRSVHTTASTRCGHRWSRCTEAGKQPIPPWDAGMPAAVAPDKANELTLPEGRRP